MSHLLFNNVHEWFINTFIERSRMVIDYMIHELSEYMTVHEQPKFMSSVTVHEQNKFMNS